MKSVLLYFLFAFLLNQLSTADAAYSRTNSTACPLAGLGVPTCRGVGTTDVSDLLNYVLTDKESYAIVGVYESLYVVSSAAYKSSPGVDAFLGLISLLAYVLEVPQKCGGHTYYLVSVVGCPFITTITGCSKGVIPSTTLTYATIYEAISQTSRLPYNLPCNVILGPDLRQPRYTSFYNLDADAPITFSDLVSFVYYPFDKKCSSAPYDAAVKYGLDVQRINGTSYVQSGYLDGAKPCYRVDDVPPIAVALLAAGFDFAVVYKKNGLCLLSTAIAALSAAAKYPYYLLYRRIVLLTKPYNFAAIIDGYLQTDLGGLIYGPMTQLC